PRSSSRRSFPPGLELGLANRPASEGNRIGGRARAGSNGWPASTMWEDDPLAAPRGGNLRPTMSLLQLMELVIFAAAASFCLAPMIRLAMLGAVAWEWMLVGVAMGVPVVLALVAFPLVRSGPLKDWLIRALLLASVGVGLGFSFYSLLWGRGIWAT